MQEYSLRTRRGMMRIAEELGLKEYLSYAKDEIEFEEAVRVADNLATRTRKENGGELYNSEIWHLVFSASPEKQQLVGGAREGEILLLSSYLQHTDTFGTDYFRIRRSPEKISWSWADIHKKRAEKIKSNALRNNKSLCQEKKRNL